MNLKIVTTALLGTMALSACKSTPEPDMALPSGFAQLTQLLTIKHPNTVFSDDAWHQSIGAFQLTNMDLSGITTEKVNTSTGWQVKAWGGLLVQLIFHEKLDYSGHFVDRFNTRAEQSFSFQIQATGQAPVQAECQMLLFGTSEESQDNNAHNDNRRKSAQTSSYLGCKLTQQGLVSELVVEESTGTMPKIRLHQGSKALDVSLVQPTTEMAQFNAIFHGGPAGYLLAADGQNKAALQLSSFQSRLWLTKDLPAAQQQWLVAALFSLQMFDWQNDSSPMASLNP